MIHSRVVWMLRPVERSITVSAPQRIAHTIFSTSSSTEEVTAELPILALILVRKFLPMIIGSSSAWLILEGMMARPRATSLRTNSGVTKAGTAARKLSLRHRLAVEGAQRTMCRREIAREVLAADIAVVDGLDRTPLVVFDAAALAHPCGARARQPLLDVDRHVGIGIGAGGVVNRNRRLGGGLGEHDLAHGHTQLGRRVGARIDLARGRQRSGRDLGRGDVGVVDVHRVAPDSRK